MNFAAVPVPHIADLPAHADPARPDVSVVVVLKERPEALPALYDEYSDALRAAGRRAEFIVVAEPWAYGMTRELATRSAAGAPIRILEVGQAFGEAALLRIGVEAARAEVVVTLPAYRRVEAFALPQMVAAVESGADLVVARRWPRTDSALNRLQNRAFHTLIAPLTRDRVHDVACGVHAMRRDLLAELPLYGDFHRFLPLFALRDGYRVREIAVPQHPADTRTRVAWPGVYLRRAVDVIGLFFLLRFTDKPLRFFGLAGVTVSGVGALLLLVLLVQRIGGAPLADRPLLLLAVLLLVLGIQAIALGLVGEIIVHFNAPGRDPYRVAGTRRGGGRRGEGAA